MRIAIIGAGQVGTALGTGWARKGHDIAFGVTNPADSKDADAAQAAAGARVLTTSEAVRDAEAIVLAVPWAAVGEALVACGDPAGRIVIDATNPLTFGANGLELAIGFSTSGGEEVARLAPGASVFKTMNQVGFAVMSDTAGFAAPPVMFVAGDDAAKKPIVLGLVADLGFEARDAGPLDRSRLLEPYGMVWIEQAILHGGPPNAAFAYLKKGQA